VTVIALPLSNLLLHPGDVRSLFGSLSSVLEDQVGLVEAIEHLLAGGLEGRGEQVVHIRLIGEVDSRDGCRAGIALIRGEAACGVDGCSDSALDLGLLVILPVLESRVILHEG